MYRVVLSAALMLFLMVPAARAQGLSGGIRTGVNFANMEFGTNAPDIQTEDVNSLVLAVAFEVGATNFLAFRTELGYSQRGFKVTEERGTSAVSLQYLTLPILTDFTLPLGVISPHVYTGPSVAIEVGCSVGSGNAALVLFGESCGSAEANTNLFDFGWVFAGGLVVRSGGGRLFLDLSYDLGLTDVTGDPNTEVRNGAVAITLAFLFPLGG